MNDELDIPDIALKMSGSLRLFLKKNLNGPVYTQALQNPIIRNLLSPEALAFALADALESMKESVEPSKHWLSLQEHEEKVEPYQDKFMSEFISLPNGEYEGEMSGHTITLFQTNQTIHSDIGIRCMHCPILIVVEDGQVIGWCQAREGSCSDPE